MQRIQKIVRVLFCAAVVSVLLSSCNNPTPTPQPAPSPAPAPTPSPAPAPSPAPTPSPAPIGGVFNKDEVYIPPIGSGSSGSSAPIISGGGSSSGGGTGGGSAPAITVTLASVVGGTSVTDSGITYEDFTSATILKAYPGASVAAIWTAIEAAIGTSNLGDYRIFAANNPTGSATAANAVSQANLTTLVGSATSKTIYVAKKQAAPATITITLKSVDAGTSVTDSDTYKNFTNSTILKVYPAGTIATVFSAIQTAMGGAGSTGDYRIFGTDAPSSASAANAVSQANLTTLVGSATSKTIYVAKKATAGANITLTLASVAGGTSVTDSSVTYKDFADSTGNLLKTHTAAPIATVFGAIQTAMGGASSTGDYRIFAADDPGAILPINTVSQTNLEKLVGADTTLTLYVAKKNP